MLAYKYKIYLIIAFIIIVAIIVFCCNFASLEGKYVYDFTSYGYKFPMSISLYKITLVCIIMVLLIENALIKGSEIK